MPSNESAFVSRGGIKLAHALDVFQIDVTGLGCADFGCSTGGFTDCLLQRGAQQVFAIDTAYGILDYRLRTDSRVVVMERTNVLHAKPADDGVDLVVIDAGWTPQRLILPVARQWLAGRNAMSGRIISLIKPHYELEKLKNPPSGQRNRSTILDDDQSRSVCDEILGEIGDLGFAVQGVVESPIRGGGSRSKSGEKGNIEFLANLVPSA